MRLATNESRADVSGPARLQAAIPAGRFVMFAFVLVAAPLLTQFDPVFPPENRPAATRSSSSANERRPAVRTPGGADRSRPIRQTGATEPQTGTRSARHPLQKAIARAEQAARVADRLPGYTARLTHFTAANGKTKVIDLKLLTKPLSIYLKFQDEHAGREVLYVDGWNRNRLIVHEGRGPLSLIGTISLDPFSERAMADGGRPITQTGLAELARGVAGEWRDSISGGIRPNEVHLERYPTARLGNVECEAIEVRLDRNTSPTGTHLLRLFMRADNGLPIAFQAYGFPATAGQRPQLIEEVRYTDLDTERTPSPRDFDPRNPAYNF